MSKKKKIVAVFHDNNIYSGATQSFLSNIEYLIERGHCLYAVVPDKDGSLNKYLEELGVCVSVQKYGGNVYSSSLKGLKKAEAYFRCMIKTLISFGSCVIYSKRIKKLHIDIVYTNTSTIYYGYWLSKLLRAKHVWHFREFCDSDQNSLRFFEGSFFKKANNADYVITISKALDQYYCKKYKLTNTRMLYNDINEKHISNSVYHEEINILITGTLSEGKGQLVAIEAMRRLGADVNLFIAGQVNDYGQYLVDYVKSNNIPNIHFLGFVESMSELRQRMNFSLVCSKQEAFGRTIIEDMLAGVVVIGCNTGAVPELIKDKKTGLLYEQGNSESLAKAINFAIDNNHLMEECKKNARLYAEKFTEKSTAKQIALIMEEL